MATVSAQQLYQAVEQSLQAEKFAPIYFFYGDEPYLIQKAVEYVKVCALHGGVADFNLTSFYAADTDVSRIRDEVETLPMMSARRVVLVREVQDFTDREWDELEPLFKTPVDSTVFILVAGRIDKRKKYFKSVSEAAVTAEFKKPYDNTIPGWIRQIAKSYELEIDDDALLLLHRLVGSQLIEIEAEVKKVANYIGMRKHILLEDVAQCVSKRREENVFDLAASLAEGDRHQALLQLADLLENGQSEVGIVALVARHVRLLLMLKQGQEQGLSGQKLAAYAQVPSYFLPDYLAQCRVWTPYKLEQVLLILAETDKALKSSPLSSHIWLENMILKVCALVRVDTHRSTRSAAPSFL